MKFNFPHKYLSKQVSEKTLAKKKQEGKCRHHGCQNYVRHERATDCATCASRKQRLNNPVNYAYNMLKVSASKRGISFEITFQQFQKFNDETGYVEKMGRGPDNLTVDRIDSSEPYTIDNIRALSYEDNVSRKLEQMEFPGDPIAMALCDMSGSKKNWRAFRRQADEVYDLVCRLQKYQEPIPEEPEDDNCPF